MNKTHAQLAYEAYLGSTIDWTVVTPATKELWLTVAAAVLSACDESKEHA